MCELEACIKQEGTTPQIIGIQEVKPKICSIKRTEFDFKLNNYDMFAKNIDNEQGRGVILYTHKSLRAEPANISSEFEEIVWAEVTLI